MTIAAILWTLRLLAYPLLAYTVFSVSLMGERLTMRQRVLHFSIGILFLGLFVLSLIGFSYGYSSPLFIVVRDYVLTLVLLFVNVISWIVVIRSSRQNTEKIKLMAENVGMFNRFKNKEA